MHVTNVMAMSLDAQIASAPDERDEARAAAGFTNQDDKDHLLALLRTADAVVVGSRSLLASGGAFEQLNDKGRQPAWVVATNRGLPAGAPFWRQAGVPRWLASQSALTLPDYTGAVEAIVYGASPPAAAILQALAARGLDRVLLFGGSEVNRLFYSEGLVDELWLTVCPLILGSSTPVPLVMPPLPRRVHLGLKASKSRGDLVFLNYTVLPPR
jgi:5-amino-6-(5-phosphoribosylamino)uracil reductase